MNETKADKFKRLQSQLAYASVSNAPIEAVQDRASDLLDFVIENAMEIERGLSLRQAAVDKAIAELSP